MDNSTIEDIKLMLTNAHFRPKLLDQTKSQIRLLHLPRRTHQYLDASTLFAQFFVEAETNQSPYECWTEVVSLDDAPQYEALSYCWGANDITCRILIDGQAFYLRKNLATALHCITAKRDAILWIDAICINQNDNVEKSWQIVQMRRVYEGAESVIAWLGYSLKNQDKAMRALNDLAWVERLSAATFFSRFKAGQVSEQEIQSLRRGLSMLKGFKHCLDNPITREEEIVAVMCDISYWPLEAEEFPLLAVRDLLLNRYFSRIWTLQEFALARKVSFICGYYELSGDALQYFLKLWDGTDTNGSRILLDHRPFAMSEVRTGVQIGIPLPMKDLLQISWKAALRATNPEDQIYGFLGVAKDVNELGFRVDVARSFVDVYTDIALKLLDSDSLWMLSFAGLSESTERSLPTWVPDWNAERGEIPLLQSGKGAMTGEESPFSASNQMKPSVTFIDQTPPRCAFVGVCVDVVQTVGSTRPNGRRDFLSPEQRSAIVSWLRDDFRNLISLNGVYCSKHARNEAVWRTPVANVHHHGYDNWRAPDKEVKEAYDALVHSDLSETALPPRLQQHARNYFSNMMMTTMHRRPFSTAKGYIGLGSKYVSSGDLVVILCGADMPFVIRENDSGYFHLVGEAYVHGIMHGEAFDGNEDEAKFECIEIE